MSALSDAALAAALFAVDPVGVGGVCLRSLAHPARDRWLQILRDSLPEEAAVRRIPCNIPVDRLLGGLDLAATLKANRPVAQRGVLAAADGGVVVIAMAERLTAHTAGCLNAVLDAGEITMLRDSASAPHPARVGVVALDESISEDEFVAASLLDRVAFLLDFSGFSARTRLIPAHDRPHIMGARRLLPRVQANEEHIRALCATALALGAGSARVSLLALRVARAAAALEARTVVNDEDAVLAARLVLAPRATLMPAARPESPMEATPETSRNPPDAPPPNNPPLHNSDGAPEAEPKTAKITAADLENMILAATQASIPNRLLAQLGMAAGTRSNAGGTGRVGAVRNSGIRGRPCGVRNGNSKGRGRLNVIETLRAAAPWQRTRARGAHGDMRLRVEPPDFRITRYTQRARTLTIFAVDASGSSALNRLAEAKGAVELLLADCYIRRDHVAVIAFRDRSAELLLPPTRSLVRAKRSLAGLPGGGGTPLAAAIQSALRLALQAQRRGDSPTVVILTDGRANIARNGAAGRETAHAEALDAARAMRRSNIAALLIDTSQRPNPLAKELADVMRAHYLALPHAGARRISRVIQGLSRPSSMPLRPLQ